MSNQLEFQDYSDSVYDEFDDQPPELIRCRSCKRKRFTWFQDDNGKWRLITSTGRLHTCKFYKRQERKKA